MDHAWIISCGTELTLGHTVDTNAAWLAERLAAIGVRTDRIVIAPDVADALRDVLRQASQSADLVLLTGGLGPTEDDLAREALADVAGVSLELDPGCVEQIKAYFVSRGREMSDRNRTQAMIPRGGRALTNECGTAPGIAVELDGTPIYALPGVPFEMRAMFVGQVVPRLQRRSTGGVLLTRRLHCFGLGESDLGGRVRDLMAPARNPSVGTQADMGVVSLRICATAADHAAAVGMLDACEREIRDRLGRDRVFGRDEQTLASVVGDLLVAAGATVSTAESCTGGLIGKFLTDVAGSSRYYAGGIVAYANDVKQRALGVPAELLAEHGAVSAPVAEALASGAQTALDTDYALSTTGVGWPGRRVGGEARWAGFRRTGDPRRRHGEGAAAGQRCAAGRDSPARRQNRIESTAAEFAAFGTSPVSGCYVRTALRRRRMARAALPQALTIGGQPADNIRRVCSRPAGVCSRGTARF